MIEAGSCWMWVMLLLLRSLESTSCSLYSYHRSVTTRPCISPVYDGTTGGSTTL